MPLAQTFIIGLCADDVKKLEAGDVLTMPGEELGIAGVTFLLVYRAAAENLAVEVARLRDIGNANPLPDQVVEQPPAKESIEPEHWAKTVLLCKLAGPPPQDWGLLGYSDADPPGAALREFRRVKYMQRPKLEKELESWGYRPLKKGDPREIWQGDDLENWSRDRSL